ncbi:hypothetical protein [Catenulispora pinisilvae]|uniref:hypothetical protein n=1 Tax=Catenulispora pinisilvae TaxID=2705253 RepID=UPI0018927350|nr:hypothetical protein [Catenulispora pinisilvae]
MPAAQSVANSLARRLRPGDLLAALRARLTPDGRIAIVSQPRCHSATADTSRDAADEIRALLTTAGFTKLRTEILPLNPPVVCVLGS